MHSGGPKAIREALAARRTRGPGKKPAKTLLTLRIAPAVIERWKATGPGWQTRIDEALRDWYFALINLAGQSVEQNAFDSARSYLKQIRNSNMPASACW